jgi:hypothetical protein
MQLQRSPNTLLIGRYFFLLLLSILMSRAALAREPIEKLELISSKPLPELTGRFYQASGWIGSDGAYSIPLFDRKTLWLFGDTYIGMIEEGKRVNPHFINNSAALQDVSDRGALRFFWGENKGTPCALLSPPEKNGWLWPGDGAFVDDALYLFYKIITSTASGAPGFNFQWSGDILFKISNPMDVQAWNQQSRIFPASAPQMGTACLVKDGYLYLYGLARSASPKERKTIVARISCQALSSLCIDGLEYWCQEGKWIKKGGKPMTLFEGGATEMSVSRVPGIDGYVATYTPGGFGSVITIRHAPAPEGPWGPPLTVYHCPEEGSKLLVYGAKAHPEFSREAGQLVITYCRNTGSLEEDITHPEIYFPQAVEVRLRPGKN